MFPKTTHAIGFSQRLITNFGGHGYCRAENRFEQLGGSLTLRLVCKRGGYGEDAAGEFVDGDYCSNPVFSGM